MQELCESSSAHCPLRVGGHVVGVQEQLLRLSCSPYCSLKHLSTCTQERTTHSANHSRSRVALLELAEHPREWGLAVHGLVALLAAVKEPTSKPCPATGQPAAPQGGELLGPYIGKFRRPPNDSSCKDPEGAPMGHGLRQTRQHWVGIPLHQTGNQTLGVTERCVTKSHCGMCMLRIRCCASPCYAEHPILLCSTTLACSQWVGHNLLNTLLISACRKDLKRKTAQREQHCHVLLPFLPRMDRRQKPFSLNATPPTNTLKHSNMHRKRILGMTPNTLAACPALLGFLLGFLSRWDRRPRALVCPQTITPITSLPEPVRCP